MKERAESLNIEIIPILISEISPSKLSLFKDVDAYVLSLHITRSWIQVACPRLSIDWGEAFEKPLLTPYEASVLFGSIPWQSQYPMDYYSKNGLGPWTNYHNGKAGSNICSK